MLPIVRKPPIADQVRQLLRQRIQEGVYAPENRLPSETQLSQEFQVSRATIRTALTSLATEGLLIRRQGDGTYINSGLIQVYTRIDTLWEFTHLIEESGRKPSIQPIKMEYRAPSPTEAHSLHLPLDAQVVSLVRVFCADQRPVIYSTNILPQSLLCIELQPSKLSQSIFEIIEGHCGLSISYAIADISAIVADEETAHILAVDQCTALLRFEEVFYDHKGQPLVYTMNFYNDKLLRLKVVRAKT